MTIERIYHFADATPDAIAITRHGSKLTYREFADAISSARTEFIARHITGNGIVGVAIWDHQQSWICSLALRSLGLTTLPIRAPETLPDLLVPGLRYVVGSPSWPGLKEMCRTHGLCLVPPPSLAAPSSIPAESEILDGGHILVTSATTGKPKMVLWDQAAFEAALSHRPETDAQTVYHVFNYGAWTLAGFRLPSCVWSNGGEIIIHQEEERYKALRNLNGTHATLLPAFLAEILAAPEGSFPYNENLNLYLGGGTVTAWQVQEIKRRVCPNVFNRISSTEVGTFASTLLRFPEDQRWHSLLPGRGVEIVDADDSPATVGEIGQLRVPVGNGISGYFNDPEATAQFFRHGYFYPGDLAVMRDDGRIALQGRTTEIININGSKIAPGPLEDLLREHHKLSGVCLLSAQNQQGEEQLHVVVETVLPLPTQVIEQILNEFSHVSANVYTVTKLPRTGTGKVIRAEVQALIWSM